MSGPKILGLTIEFFGLQQFGMFGAVTYSLYLGFSETDDKIESKVVCGKLTL